MRFSLFKLLPFMCLLFASACGFLRDNAAPQLIHQVKQSASDSSHCKDALSGGKEFFGTDLLLQVHSCLDFVYKDSKNAFVLAEQDRFNESELKALIEHFVFDKSKVLDAKELSALFLLKQIAVGGDLRSLSFLEFEKFLERFKAIAEKAKNVENSWELRETSLEQEDATSVEEIAKTRISEEEFFNDLLKNLVDHWSGEAVVKSEHVRGLISLGLHFASSVSGKKKIEISESVKKHLESAVPEIVFEWVLKILGYETKKGLRLEKLKQLPDFYKIYSKVSGVNIRTSLIGAGAEVRFLDEIDGVQLKKELKRLTALYDEGFQNFLTFTEWREGASFSQNDMQQFLLLLKNNLDQDLNLFPEDLAKKIFIFKNHLFGGGKAIGLKTAEEIFSLIKQMRISSELSFIVFDLNDNSNSLNYEAVFPYQDFWSFYKKNHMRLLQQSTRRLTFINHFMKAGFVDLRDAWGEYFLLKVSSSLVAAADKGGDYILRKHYGQSDSDFMVLVKQIANLYLDAQELTETLSEENEASAQEAIDKRRQRRIVVDSLLDSSLWSSIILFKADNLSLPSNGDGGINSSELKEFTRFLDEVRYKIGVFSQKGALFWMCDSIAMSIEFLELDIDFSKIDWEFFFRVNELVSPDYSIHRDVVFLNFLNYSYDDLFELNADLHFSRELYEVIGLRVRWAIREEAGLMLLSPLGLAASQALFRSIIDDAFVTIYPRGTTRHLDDALRDFRALSPKKRTEFNEIEDLIINEEQIENYFKARLHGAGFDWLQKKVQLFFLVAPDKVSHQFFTKLLVNAPDIASKYFELRKKLASPTQDQLIEILFDFESKEKKSEKRELNSFKYSELHAHVVPLTLMFADMSLLFQK